MVLLNGAPVACLAHAGKHGEALLGTYDRMKRTRALLDYMQAEGERMSVCLVGEPTCPDTMGEMIKIGRRGSVTAWIEVVGVQGHAAYPHRAKNPLPAMARLMDRLSSHELDRGTEHFDASTLAVVTIDTGNPATNVIPAQTRGTVNIRFNDTHSGASLSEKVVAIAKKHGGTALPIVSGEPFLTPPGAFSAIWRTYAIAHQFSFADDGTVCRG